MFTYFKSGLDKFWLDQPIMFDWKTDITSNRSFKYDSTVEVFTPAIIQRRFAMS